jgi:hypothetical protein
MNETKVLSIVVLVVAIILLPFRGRIVPALRRAIMSIRKTHHRRVIFIGLFDVTLLGVMAFALLCPVSGRGPLSTLWALALWILANPLPCLVPTAILAIVGWRGVTDAKRVITDRAGYLRPVLEGFFGAFMLPILEFLVRLAPIAYAGIPLYGEARSWNFVEWLTFIVGVLWESLKAGVLGAALGGLFAAINRLTIKRLIHGRTTACTGSPINPAPGDP